MGGGGENEGDPTTTGISPTTGGTAPRRRRHRRQRRAENDCPALDLPPTIASPMPQWQPRRLATRTPQRLCSCVLPPPLRRQFQSENGFSVRANFAPCDPLIAFGEYILTATDDARICVHYIESSLFSLNKLKNDPSDLEPKDKIRKSLDTVMPIAVVDLCGPNNSSSDFPSIIALSCSPSSGMSAVSYIDSSTKSPQNASPPGFLGHIAVLSSEGCIYVIEFTKHLEAPLKVTCVYSWDTDDSATCLTLHSSPKPDQNLRVCVGYENGSIADWEVSVPVVPGIQKDRMHNEKGDNGLAAKRDSKDPNISTTSEQASNSWNVMWKRAKARLLWRGCFESPIKSISSIGMEVGSEEGQLESKSAEKYDDRNNVRNSFLAVCTLNSTHDTDENQLKTNSNVEVINIGAIEQDWNITMAETKVSSSSTAAGEDEYVALPMGDYCTWPGAGMEILSTVGIGSANNRDLPRRIRGINSRGTNRVYACHGPEPSFVATLNEGTIALMHAFVNSPDIVEESGELSWGIAQEANQLLMSYPCIGVGQVMFPLDGQLSNNSASNCLACCLRGGTVYVIPILQRQTPNHDIQTDVTVFSCESGDSESNLNYVQGFTAGNIGTEAKQNPVFVYCWAGGVMDVYASGLLPKKKESETENNANEVLQDLVANGYAQRLLELLLGMNETDMLLQDDIWKKAWIECNEHKVTNVDILQEKPAHFRAFQTLLLELALESF